METKHANEMNYGLGDLKKIYMKSFFKMTSYIVDQKL